MPSASRTPTILVVDDDEDIRDMVAELLVSEGWNAVAAANGQHALDLLAVMEPPALVLLDMRMPVMDGYEFAAEYRRRVAAPAPIVVMTAISDPERSASWVGAVAFLGKPFEVARMFELVAHHAKPVEVQPGTGPDPMGGTGGQGVPPARP